jgi:hypothetical protein
MLPDIFKPIDNPPLPKPKDVLGIDKLKPTDGTVPYVPRDKGLGVTCSKCVQANLYNENINLNGCKSIGEQFAELTLMAQKGNWSYKVISHEDGQVRADFFCPKCTNDLSKAKDVKPLPKYNVKALCPKCATPKAKVSYCDGLSNCKFDVNQDHLHRECTVCGFVWAESCLDKKGKKK